MGRQTCEQIQVIHAFSGWDTTSAIFRFGKGTISSKLASNSYIHHQLDTLLSSEASATEVKASGVAVMVAL